MANYLFTLTITPVQSFISQARKTKDLFSGSEILSKLMQESIKKVKEKENIEMIFPQDIDFVSNKFVVKLENKNQEEIKKIGEELEKYINNDFMKFVFNETCKFDSAFKNFFTVFWVAVELGDDYKKSYNELEQNLGAIKNLRIFEQNTQLLGKAKCVLCGERNQSEENKGDKLCLICYTKRTCTKNKTSYPSTAKIALLDWLKKVPNSNEYKKLFKKPFDESLYFKENLSKEYLTKWEYFKSDDGLQKAIKFLDNLDIETKQKKYYALIQFDIDDMGKKLSELDENGQRELSKALGEFAQKAKNIVDTQNNNVDKTECTIYAGGDDFLGFVNLAYLFEVMEEIKSLFTIDDLTYSTSIVIAHYKSPLHKVLDFSRSLLDETKNHFDDKDGIGIIVLSDSAINAKNFCKYEDVKLLQELNKNEIGKNLHFKLHSTFSFIESKKSIDEDEYESLIVMIEYEIKRLLKREEGDFNQDLYVKLIAFVHNQVDGLSRSKNIQIDFDNFVAYLKTLEQFKKVM